MNKTSLSLIICTHERPALLKDCLESIASAQPGSKLECRILVVDNSRSPESTEKNAALVAGYNSCSHYHFEASGLSLARNEGLRLSTTEYVGYIDDDSIVAHDFFTVLEEIISIGAFHCFGGAIISRWPFGRPRWLSPSFGSKPKLRDNAGPIKYEYLWGGNLFFKRKTLLDLGGFEHGIGMSRDRLGYGAENQVQMNFRAAGYVIGYHPGLVVHHAVLRHKLNLWWHIRAAYVTARDGRAFFKEQYGIPGFLRSVKHLVSAPLRGVVALVRQKDYFPENLFLDVLIPWARVLGKLTAILSK